MYSLKKSWDNRRAAAGLPKINGRTWTRRIHWLEGTGLVKLKFWWFDEYREAEVQASFAQTVWDRFRAGDSVEDALSIFGRDVPKCRQSIEASRRGT